jgi:hypothetical protein
MYILYIHGYIYTYIYMYIHIYIYTYIYIYTENNRGTEGIRRNSSPHSNTHFRNLLDNLKWRLVYMYIYMPNLYYLSGEHFLLKYAYLYIYMFVYIYEYVYMY